jgi:methyltransferase (TIGR00027 family)
MGEAPGPSRTAMLAALGRAVHLLRYGSGALVHDWLAWPLLGEEADGLLDIGYALIGEDVQPYATWLAARTRLSDEWLETAGSAQHVILGAGLDSSAWRHPNGPRVFEVDHVGSQTWKRSRVERLRLEKGPEWVPVDFERDRLGVALSDAGLTEERVFVSWHGVVPYLSHDAVIATLQQLPPCTLAVSYVPPERAWDADARPSAEAVQAAAAAIGEPWLTFTTPAELATLVGDAGFTVVDDVGAADIARRYGVPAVNFERMALATRTA